MDNKFYTAKTLLFEGAVFKFGDAVLFADSDNRHYVKEPNEKVREYLDLKLAIDDLMARN